ncbi:MAG: reverse transcriptase family protein [Candidatus Thiodiazotropha endolucinida]
MSSDKKKNNTGYRLLDICKNNNLTILNGRFGRDQNVGKPTFRGISVLDYTISSIRGLRLLTDFEIIELDRLYSDGHALLSFSINISFNDRLHQNAQQQSRARPPWNARDSHLFYQNIDIQKVHTLTDQIKQHMHENSLTQSAVDSIVSEISEVFERSAAKSFRNNTKRTLKRSRKNKPWFGPACHNTRKAYNIARKKYNKFRSTRNRTNLQRACKIYKNTMNKFKDKHNQSNEQKLRNMHTKHPKEYCKFLNSIKSNETSEIPDISTFYEYFKEVNSSEYNQEEDSEIINDCNLDDNEYLNASFTVAEIEKCIKNLKNSKSPGIDNILNEYIKNSKAVLLPFYVQLFNSILDTGIIPTSWVEGIIIPLYKNKGNSMDPDNYRPITLLSCLGKLFTAVLNNRLNAYLEEYELLNENQAGFRKQYSTTDHIFTLHCIIDLLRFQKRKIYCTFIDFSKAFDSVWRIRLWRKLLNAKINGKFFNVIHNLYLNIKSCISLNNEKSAFFDSHCGVRQGENLSPVLFSLFLNDLEDYLRHKHNDGIVIDINSEDVSVFLKLIILLYADDTVILAQDTKSLQKNLNDFYDYCNEWKLKINTSKSKVIIFGSRGKQSASFKIGPNTLEIVDNYKYLGVFFAKSGSFLAARKHIAAQARKALHLLYTRINNLFLPVDLQLKLFDHTVLPILTYACEVWGYENTQILERVHSDFLRKITKTRKSTPHYMLYAELGRYPIDIIIKSRMIGFWNRIISGPQSKLSYLLYTVINNTPNFESKWLTHIKKILNDTGRFDFWLTQSNIHCYSLGKIVKRILIDQNLQNWHSSLQHSSKGINYQLFKNDVNLEPYFLLLQPKHFIPLVKFRTGNHYFPIETKRWEGIPLNQRRCTLCNCNDIADEFHYLINCSYFSTQRQKYIQRYYYIRPNILKYKELLALTSTIKLKKLCVFIKILLNHFSTRR